ncbi:MAG TPA: cupredoxin domain-containing protein [Caulobacteraceae bacterium]|nr:cupredoxin domain-containing protein [Caulobacteraceae bacterium]
MRHPFPMALAALAAAGSLAAAHAATHHAAPAATHAPKTWTITITSLAFTPAPSGMRVGDTVQWVNNDIFLHSATAADHSFDVALPPHKTGSAKLTHAGTIAYVCRYHPGMKGQLVVAP